MANEFVQQFPLTRIRDGNQLDAAQKMIDHLLGEDRDRGAEEYLDVLTDLVVTLAKLFGLSPNAFLPT